MSVKTLIVALLWVVVNQQPATPSDADWEWLDKNRAEAFEALMPVASRSLQIVAYRTYRDLYHTVHESHFAINYVPTSKGMPVVRKVIATMSAPKGSSVQEQLLNLHMSNRRATLPTLLRRVSMERFTITEDKCPALRTQFDAFYKVSLGFSDPNVFTLHPTMHQFVINTGAEEINATITDSESAAARWATETAAALRKCAG